jgi:hypothetical protein
LPLGEGGEFLGVVAKTSKAKRKMARMIKRMLQRDEQ